jgi:hypothetical protein
MIFFHAFISSFQSYPYFQSPKLWGTGSRSGLVQMYQFLCLLSLSLRECSEIGSPSLSNHDRAKNMGGWLVLQLLMNSDEVCATERNR